MITAKIVADSKNEFGNRITTMVVTFPRYILAELNTHRMFSRNSASSRAIPFNKMVEAVEKNPFIPLAFQKDHKGMQGTEYFEGGAHQLQVDRWAYRAYKRCEEAKESANIGLTKQLVNRSLEEFMWHTVIITATELENFFYLRCPKYSIEEMKGEFRSRKDYCAAAKKEGRIEYPKDYSEVEWLQINKGQADIHMMALAEAMWDAYNESTPKELKAGEWHIPFGDDIDIEKLKEAMFHDHSVENEEEAIDKYKIMVATARCARVSYTVVGEEDKPDNYEADIKLHDRLASMGHWSPFEHCGKAMTDEEYIGYTRAESEPYGFRGPFKGRNFDGWSGNLRGFIQYRKMFKNENVTTCII